MNPIPTLTSLGQSLWYDNIQRRLLENGELKAMIARGDVRGVTSNPTIFQNAIAKSNDYDAALTPLAWGGWDAEKIFWRLAIEDIQEGCDLFRALYDSTDGGDGFVSLEVSPALADDTDATIRQAKDLWERVGRPNLMVKIPATKAGIPAIRASIAAGLNINVTLIFSLQRYAEVMEAYLAGLEDRAKQNQSIARIASVASFFVSRVDTKIDPQLPQDSALRGKAAIANAKLAYEAFESVFGAARFGKLKNESQAREQRPLWASTGTKNPAYSDTLYVDNLIGAHTVNTVPPATLTAYRDHGTAAITITTGLDRARADLAALEAAGISMQKVTQELEDEGVRAFADAYKTLLEAIRQRSKSAVASLGPIADSASERLNQLDLDSVPARVWTHDPLLWAQDAAGQTEVKIRMGWLDSVADARRRLPGYLSFADEVRAAGLDRVLILGMGGSSLTAEVLANLMAAANIETSMTLAILDSTDPHQVLQAARFYPPDRTLYILASKSGGTAEVLASFDYFWKLSNGDASRFIAITDPGTSLEKLAKDRGFRKIFSADASVGGRYSALTDFGLVPAALMGMDLPRLLESANSMRRQCAAESPAARNPGAALGTVLAEAALAGRDKLTILADESLAPLANWIEQLVAESSGKHGKGILPVAHEPLDVPQLYGNDRLFIYFRQSGELDTGVAALKQAGHPVIEYPMASPYDAGAEFFRWEFAVAVACSIIEVNAFDQPDVQDSKIRTLAKIADFQKTGRLAEVDLVALSAAGPAMQKFLSDVKPGDFIAINAYLPRNKETVAAMQLLRVALREKTNCAVATGFGPRFQHSTGQFHKGGPNRGHFLQVVYDVKEDAEIPTQGLTFGTLLRAQALGDYEALRAAGRRVLRVDLPTMNDFRALTPLVPIP